MPVDLRRGVDLSDLLGKKKQHREGIDVSKAVSASTLYNDVVYYLGNRPRARQRLQHDYTLTWTTLDQKYDEQITQTGALPYEYIDEFSIAAAQAFLPLAKEYFLFLREDEEDGPCNFQYYLEKLSKKSATTLDFFLLLGDTVLSEVEQLFSYSIAEKIRIQFSDSSLQESFLDNYESLFLEHGYNIQTRPAIITVHAHGMNVEELTHYLFALAENKLDEIIKQQPPGREKIKKIDKGVIVPSSHASNS